MGKKVDMHVKETTEREKESLCIDVFEYCSLVNEGTPRFQLSHHQFENYLCAHKLQLCRCRLRQMSRGSKSFIRLWAISLKDTASHSHHHKCAWKKDFVGKVFFLLSQDVSSKKKKKIQKYSKQKNLFFVNHNILKKRAKEKCWDRIYFQKLCRH